MDGSFPKPDAGVPMGMLEKTSETWVVLGRQLVDAGWIRTFTRDSGSYSLEWSVKGARRAVLIRPIIEDFGIGRSAESTMTFTRECHERRSQEDSEMREIERLFWLSCLEELSMGCEDECLWALVRLIRATSGERAPFSVSVGLVNLHLEDTIQVHGRN